MECQLMLLSAAGSELSFRERCRLRFAPRTVWRNFADHTPAWRTPARLVRFLRPVRSPSACMPVPQPQLHPLRLHPGDRVRIKSAEEIRSTLDANGRSEGLGYIPLVMDGFCGRHAVVYKTVDRFFDERQWRLLRLRNVVILEGIYCEPPIDAPREYAGCNRTCFLFWKEAWLQRA